MNVERLRIERLTSDAALLFSTFTYPALVGLLAPLVPGWVAIGAYLDEEPVGLALGRAGVGEIARLMSVFVAGPMRGRGVGGRLVAGFTAAARDCGACAVVSRIGGGNPARAAFGRALVGAGWSALDCTEIRLVGIAATMAKEGTRSKGVSGRLAQTASVRFDRWSVFDDTDWRAFDALIEEAGFFGADRRRLQVPDLDAETSVVIRRAGVPVGWVVTQRVASPLPGYVDVPTIRFASAYVTHDLARRGILIGALWHALSRQAAAYGPRSLATYHSVRPRMVALIRRRIAPLALSAEEVFESRLTLA